MSESKSPIIRSFFHDETNTISHLVADPATKRAAFIDPVLDYDHKAGRTNVASLDEILGAAQTDGFTIEWVLETHAHADHVTGAPYVKARTGAPVGIGARIVEVQEIFGPVFGAEDIVADGGDFDRLFTDGETFPLGDLTVEVIHTPGHTPADVAYRIGDAVFVGDTIFMPDYGTARADFPGGDARRLYRSIRRLLALPSETRLFMCHDYKAPRRMEYAWESTVAVQRAENIHVHDGVTEDQFVAMRTERDAKLDAPTLILPSIQVNIRAGRFPPAGMDGRRFLRIPVEMDPAIERIV